MIINTNVSMMSNRSFALHYDVGTCKTDINTSMKPYQPLSLALINDQPMFVYPDSEDHQMMICQ